MSRQVSLGGLHISTCCTQASMTIFLCSLGYVAPPSKGSQWPVDLSSPTIAISRFSPLPSLLSPPGLDLAVFTSSLWLCHFFWFRCLFSLSRIIQSHHFLQEPAQSSTSFNMPVWTLITSLLLYFFSNMYNTLYFSKVFSQGKFPKVKVWIFLVSK